MNKKTEKQKRKEKKARRNAFSFGQTNVLLMLIGLAVIVVGYMLLGKGSITAAPILLVLGYCVIVPLAIVYRRRKEKAVEGQPQERSNQKIGMGE